MGSFCSVGFCLIRRPIEKSHTSWIGHYRRERSVVGILLSVPEHVTTTCTEDNKGPMEKQLCQDSTHSLTPFQSGRDITSLLKASLVPRISTLSSLGSVMHGSFLCAIKYMDT